jgi:hypothetical protein
VKRKKNNILISCIVTVIVTLYPYLVQKKVETRHDFIRDCSVVRVLISGSADTLVLSHNDCPSLVCLRD